MKVICINSKPLPNRKNLLLEFLEEGKIYEVERIGESILLDGSTSTAYLLTGIDSFPVGFSHLRFIPCSSIDENEMQREYNLTVKTNVL